jgi:hypothetical protein
MTPTPRAPLDLLCFGEPMFEFSWLQKDLIRPGIGGDVSNTAVAARRAGASAGSSMRMKTSTPHGSCARMTRQPDSISSTTAPLGTSFPTAAPDQPPVVSPQLI